MEKPSNPGKWIAAAALVAVCVVFIALPAGKKDVTPSQVTVNPPPTPKISESESPGSTPATLIEPPAAARNRSVTAEQNTVATRPPQPPRDADAPPPEPPKPATPADRESTRRVIDNIQFALRDFRTALGGNPVGNNAEITASLLGNNLKQVKIPLPDGATVNGSGEMCDPWGTPYFFHQQSGTKMEIRSAGPDRKHWTTDDIAM